jgi:NitT/TauT family transport system substrate-binding protein
MNAAKRPPAAARGHSRRLRKCAALVAAAVLALTGCGGGDAESGTTANAGASGPEKTAIKFGILPTPDYAPIQIAIDEGYFKAEGITATTEVMSPGGAIPAVLGGSLDIVGANWISFLLGTSKGVAIAPVAESDRGTPGYAQIIVPNESPVKTLQDLDGKKVGVVSTPGNCDLIPLDSLKASGSAAKPNFVNIAIPDMPGNLQRGGIDAACVPEPTLNSVMASGKFRVVSDLFTGAYEGFPVVGFITSQKFATENPKTMAAVQRALQKAGDLARTNPDKVRQIVPKFTKISAADADAMVLPLYPEKSDMAKLQQVADVLTRTGLAANVKLPTVGG